MKTKILLTVLAGCMSNLGYASEKENANKKLDIKYGDCVEYTGTALSTYMDFYRCSKTGEAVEIDESGYNVLFVCQPIGKYFFVAGENLKKCEKKK